MKSLICLLFSALVALGSMGQDIKKVLFIGNAYTQAHSMPQMTADIASSLGDSLYWVAIYYNGYTLEQHSTNAQTLSYIAADEWDHVILQEQAQLPALSTAIFEEDVVPYAADLCQLARNSSECVKPIFFCTWASKNGDLENCETYPWVCTFDGQQDSLTSRYLQLSEINDAWCAPVGEVWRTMLDVTNEEANLFDEDGNMPTELGAYVTACTFYATIFGETPEGADIPGTLGTEDAELAQAIAGNTVLYTGQDWNLDPLVWADLQFENTGIFWETTMNTSATVDSVWVDNGTDTTTWVNGDIGAFTFPGAGTYYFVMEVFSPCGNITVLDSLEIETSISELNNGHLTLFPNPCSDQLTIIADQSQASEIFLFDRNGKLVLREQIRLINGRHELVTSGLIPGQYHVLMQQNGIWISRDFVKM